MVRDVQRQPGGGGQNPPQILRYGLAEKALVVGFHFNFPSLGYVEKDGAKYRLVPIVWNPVI